MTKGSLVTNPDNTINFELNDLVSFKKYILIALVLSILGEITYFGSSSLLGKFLFYLSLLIFSLGIMSISKKYPELSDGIKIAYLLIIVIITDFSTFFESIYNIFKTRVPQSFGKNQSSLLPISQRDMSIILEARYLYYYLNEFVILLLISALITLISLYYLSKWFNKGFSKKDSYIKSFYYFGVVYFISSIFFIVGLFYLNNFFSSNPQYYINHAMDTSTFSSFISYLNFEEDFLLFAINLEIFALFQSFKRINGIINGNMDFYEESHIDYLPEGRQLKNKDEIPSDIQYDPLYVSIKGGESFTKEEDMERWSLRKQFRSWVRGDW